MKHWLNKSKTFFIKSELNASKTARNYWLGLHLYNEDVEEIRISKKQYLELKNKLQKLPNCPILKLNKS